MDSLMRLENFVSNISGKIEHINDDLSDIKRVQRVLIAGNPNAEVSLKQETEENVPMAMPAYPRPSVGSESQPMLHESPYSSTPGQRASDGFAPGADASEEEDESTDPSPP